MYIYQFFTGAASETVGISLGKTEEVSKMIFFKVIFHGGKFNFFLSWVVCQKSKNFKMWHLVYLLTVDPRKVFRPVVCVLRASGLRKHRLSRMHYFFLISLKKVIKKKVEKVEGSEIFFSTPDRKCARYKVSKSS